MVIELDGLRFRYDAEHGVDAVSLHVPARAIYVFAGPNGAGKTTTLNVIAGLRFATEGQLVIGGCRVPLDHASPRGGVGLVPDTPVLDPRLSPEEWLAFVRGIKHAALTMAPLDVADDIELSAENRQRPIRTLSHGTQRKVALWAEVLTSSTALILDEPFQGLDPSAIAGAERVLKAYTREHRAALVSTHLLHEAATLATHVGILSRGTTVFEGAVDAFVARHGTLRDGFLALTAAT